MGLGAIFIPLYFPNGCLLKPRWRIVAVLGIAWILLGGWRLVIEPGPLYNMRYVNNPFGVERLATGLPWLSTFVVLGSGLLVMGAAALSLILRYRQSDGEVRLQIKWIAFAAALMPLAGIVGNFDGWVADLFVFLVTAAFPTSIWFAIMRYRLYDIDLIINRTLVYGVLTTTIFGLYALIVGGTGVLFQQESDLTAGLVTAVLAVALLGPRVYSCSSRWIGYLEWTRHECPRFHLPRPARDSQKAWLRKPFCSVDTACA